MMFITTMRMFEARLFLQEVHTLYLVESHSSAWQWNALLLVLILILKLCVLQEHSVVWIF